MGNTSVSNVRGTTIQKISPPKNFASVITSWSLKRSDAVAASNSFCRVSRCLGYLEKRCSQLTLQFIIKLESNKNAIETLPSFNKLLYFVYFIVFTFKRLSSIEDRQSVTSQNLSYNFSSKNNIKQILKILKYN